MSVFVNAGAFGDGEKVYIILYNYIYIVTLHQSRSCNNVIFVT